MQHLGPVKCCSDTLFTGVLCCQTKPDPSAVQALAYMVVHTMHAMHAVHALPAVQAGGLPPPGATVCMLKHPIIAPNIPCDSAS